MPKQFARFDGELSLLQGTVQRLEDCGFSAPIMITNNEYRFSVKEQLDEIACVPSSIIIEPHARNTAPAICATAEILCKKDPAALMLIAPSDHFIREQVAMARAVAAGVDLARDGQIVTFGIQPDRPETGYGYIELKTPNAKTDMAHLRLAFVEKPNEDAAMKMLQSDRYLWNSGIFLMSAQHVCDLFETQSVATAVQRLRANKVKQADEFSRQNRPWGHYDTLALGPRFQVKSIVVKPGGKLSLQSHVHRSEHWVVVEGTATVTIDTTRKLYGENSSVYIPLGEIHRLENEGKVPIKLIEVQTGSYLG